MAKTSKRTAPGGRSEAASLRRELARQQRVEAELRQSLAAQDQVFRKLIHRMKNNLQLVISIISLRLSAVRDDDARRQELEEVLGKIHTVALIQHSLQDGGRRPTLDFAAYLGELTQTLQAPRVTLEAATTTLHVDRAVPLGLIANELIMSAGRMGASPIAVRLTQRGGKVVLSVDHAGHVLSEEAGRVDRGLQLVRALARQAQAELTLDGGAVAVHFDAEPVE